MHSQVPSANDLLSHLVNSSSTFGADEPGTVHCAPGLPLGSMDDLRRREYHQRHCKSRKVAIIV